MTTSTQKSFSHTPLHSLKSDQSWNPHIPNARIPRPPGVLNCIGVGIHIPSLRLITVVLLQDFCNTAICLIPLSGPAQDHIVGNSRVSRVGRRALLCRLLWVNRVYDLRILLFLGGGAN